MPVIFNVEIFNFQEILKKIPIIKSTWVKIRWIAFYIIPIIFFSVFVTEKIFTNKNVEDFRKKIARKYLKDSEDPSIYMTYQKELPFQKKEINFK